jgi:membrane protein
MSKKFISLRIPKLSWKDFFTLFKQTVIEFASEKSLFHGAALSYYTIFALVPILYLSIVSFGQFLGQEKMLEIISNVLTDQVGIKDVKGIIDFLNEINFQKKNTVLQGVGILVLLISSTAILSSLKHSINEFYDIELVHETKKKLILATLIEKLLHILLLMVFGLIIILAYFAQIILLSFGDFLFQSLNEFHSIFEFLTMHILPLFTNVVIFYFVFKYISDAFVPIKYALAGSLITSILLYLGQLLIKYYITHYFFAKDTGIAGTLLILLTWVYYTSQLIFFGAKFIAVYAKNTRNPLQVKNVLK